MIDSDHRIAQLDGNAAADALVEVRDKLRAVEAERLLLAAHWADLHAGEELTPAELALSRDAAGRVRVLPGCQRMVPAGADGTPEVEEFAAAELAALLGVTLHTGAELIADATNLRHRHPAAWAALHTGAVPGWLLVRGARRCAATGLTRHQARWVDAQTTPYAATLPPGRFLALVEAKIIAADPAAAEARARDAALARFVRTGRTDEHGLKTLVARASAGDIAYLVAVLDRIAVVLADHGDPQPLEARRATALRILANPARALALLTQASLDHTDPDREPDVLGEQGTAASCPGGYDWRLDPDGNRTLPILPDHRDPPDDDQGEPAAGADGSLLDPVLLRRVIACLDGFDASRLDPVTVFHLHLTDTTVLAGTGVVRSATVGPLVLAAVKEWLAPTPCPDHVASRITLRPVLDTTRIAPVDRYEFPPLMAEAVKTRHPYEVAPYGTASTDGRVDLDHPDRYRKHDDGGPPGQTRLDNAGPLGRRHHRIRTHGRWRLTHPDPDTWEWRAPHGHWLRVDPTGTTHLGRDPDRDTLLGTPA